MILSDAWYAYKGLHNNKEEKSSIIRRSLSDNSKSGFIVRKKSRYKLYSKELNSGTKIRYRWYIQSGNNISKVINIK